MILMYVIQNKQVEVEVEVVGNRAARGASSEAY